MYQTLYTKVSFRRSRVTWTVVISSYFSIWGAIYTLSSDITILILYLGTPVNCIHLTFLHLSMAHCCHRWQLFSLMDACMYSMCRPLSHNNTEIVTFKSLVWFMSLPWFQQNSHGMHADHRKVTYGNIWISLCVISLKKCFDAAAVKKSDSIEVTR